VHNENNQKRQTRMAVAEAAFCFLHCEYQNQDDETYCLVMSCYIVGPNPNGSIFIVGKGSGLNNALATVISEENPYNRSTTKTPNSS
jgi:hypothetical protein